LYSFTSFADFQHISGEK